MKEIVKEKLLVLQHGYHDPDDNYVVEDERAFAPLGTSSKDLIELFVNYFHLKYNQFFIKHVYIKEPSDFNNIEFSYFFNESLLETNKGHNYSYVYFIFINDFDDSFYIYRRRFDHNHYKRYLETDNDKFKEYYVGQLTVKLSDVVQFVDFDDDYFRIEHDNNFDFDDDDDGDYEFNHFRKPNYWFKELSVYFLRKGN